MLPEDAMTLGEKGITQESLGNQIKRFETGFPYLKILDSARVGNGILALGEADQQAAVARWDEYLSHGGEVFKFVPASGAASRMFKALFSFLDGEADTPAEGSDAARFIAGLPQFAFYGELDEACRKLYSKDINALSEDGRYKDIVAALLRPEGLNYGNLPKGLLKFHSYSDGSRTPLEEHLVEGAQTATDSHGNVNLHFTVSPEHRPLFEAKIAEAVPALEKKLGVKYKISLSEQKKSTDTVAVNPDNTPFRENGKLLFRPGGHGALIENLNDIDSAVVFIKNIDNVVPDRLKDDTVTYKKLIAGVLVTLQKQVFEYLTLLDSGKYTHDQMMEMLQFLQKKLFCKNPETKDLEDSVLAIYLKNKFNRPMRVCGMVKNVGEPGGGPFLAYNSDGTISLQILESSQIDMDDPEKKEMFEKGTHFNPVDLVCAVRDYKGHKFDLVKYVDKATGFISYKSKNGKDLKALELPGLWNGAMSDWNTVFVEVPLSTFNPVKTVNDLLREQHQ